MSGPFLYVIMGVLLSVSMLSCKGNHQTDWTTTRLLANIKGILEKKTAPL